MSNAVPELPEPDSAAAAKFIEYQNARDNGDALRADQLWREYWTLVEREMERKRAA